MADYKNSSSVEYASDLAMIFQTLDPEQFFRPVRLVDGYIVKQRGGKLGKIPYKFHTPYGRFEEVEYQEREVAA